MTLVDFINLEDDGCYFKVDVIDLSTDEDNVQKDGNVEEEEEDDDVPQSENLAEAATSLPISEQDATAATSLSMVDHGSAMSSLVEDKSMQSENHEFLATRDGAKEATQHDLIAAGDCVGKAMQSEHEAGVFLSMTERAAATSLLLTQQGTITLSLREDKSMQSGNQVFVAEVDCTKGATQSENTAKAAETPSMTERGATCKSHHVGQLCQMVRCPHIVGDGLDLCISHGGGHPHGERGSSTVPCTKSEVSIKHGRHSRIGVEGAAGNAMGSTGIYNLHAQEELKGDTEKDESCDFEAETETLSLQDKEKETSRFGKFYNRKGKRQVNTSATACKRQLSIVHSKGVPPTLHNGDSGFSVMGNVCNVTATASIGINVDCEVVVSTQQGCNKTSKGNTTCGKVHDNGSKSCMVEGCTNGAHGGTPLCIIHNSRPHIRCCAVIGCTKVARTSSEGRRGCCVKHGGGKRCKYDRCGKGAKGKTGYCIVHGGGRRCRLQGCMKGAQGRNDYCVEHGGGRRCKLLGCRASTTCGKDICSMHIKHLMSGNNSDHDMLPAPAPVHQAKKAEPSKGRNSHSVIGERSQKKQNTNDYVNTRSFNVVETIEEKGRDFICENNMLKAEQTTRRMNSESGLAAGSPPCKFRKVVPTLNNGGSGFSVLGNVCNGTASNGINLIDGEVATYQGCSKTSQQNTMCGKVHGSGSESCMVEGCTNGAHGGTPLCSIHNSRPHIRCCAVIGCSKVARTSSQGHRGCCVKHGGGKRCKYDGCGKGAKGKTNYCIAHGGGRRCKFQGCRKGAQGRSDYCLEHGGDRCCKFIGCTASTTCGKDLCSMHITNLLSGNNSDHEMLPAPAPACQAKEAEPSKGRNSHSVIGGRSQKKQNTNDYVNTRIFNVVETIEEKGRDSICQNNMLKAEQTTPRMNSESGLAAGSPPCKFRKVARTLNNGDGVFSVMGNVRNGMASIGTNTSDGEVVVSTYQGCSKTSQRNTMYGKIHDNGSESCMVESCTNGTHGGTPLCIFHNSRPHVRCCAVIGCSKVARTSSQGHRGCCVKHGGGKRCKYDGCGKGAKGKTDYCIAHGGGRRCKFQGCRKGAQGRSDYCLEHGGSRRCKFIGCSASTACGKDLCSVHVTSLLSDNNSDHEMLPAPAPACQAKEAEPSKGRNSHSVIGGRSQKKQNTNDYVNTRIFNVVETIEEKGRDSICQNNMLKAEQTTPRMNSESGLAAGSPPCKFRKVARTLNNGDGVFSVMGNVRNGMASIGTNTSDGEVVVSTYQGCSKTSQRNTMYGKIHDNGSESCMVESCTNGTHGGTPLCIFHNSRPHVRCCAVIGCSKVARTSSQGHRGCCVKHGGGKRCKYDGCGKGAKGKTDYCIAHGGGRRCKFQGCRKGAKGRSDYCLEHGGSRRCKFIGCSASTACGKDLCSVHVTSLLSDNNSDHEMLPAPACEARKAEPSKRRNTHSVIGGISQRRQNTIDCVNTVVEAGEEKCRVFVCQNNMLKAQ